MDKWFIVGWQSVHHVEFFNFLLQGTHITRYQYSAFQEVLCF